MADNPKEEFLQLVKRFGAFLTVKMSNLFQRLVIIFSLSLTLYCICWRWRACVDLSIYLFYLVLQFDSFEKASCLSFD